MVQKSIWGSGTDSHVQTPSGGTGLKSRTKRWAIILFLLPSKVGKGSMKGENPSFIVHLETFICHSSRTGTITYYPVGTGDILLSWVSDSTLGVGLYGRA